MMILGVALGARGRDDKTRLKCVQSSSNRGVMRDGWPLAVRSEWMKH